MENPVFKFYYSTTLPTVNACAVAQISGPNYLPADIVGINNSDIYLQGPLSIWMLATLEGSLSAPADFTALGLNVPVAISGSTSYIITDQVFIITDQVDNNNNPLFYQHVLPTGVPSGVIVNLNGKIVLFNSLISNGILYHNADGGAYFLRYIDSLGFVHTDILQYDLVISPSEFDVSVSNYTMINSLVSVSGTGTYYVQFLANNGMQLLPPYSTLSNVPWYVRVRFGNNPIIPEWAIQPFVPQKPNLFAAWVGGVYLGKNVIEFDRKNVYYDGSTFPDILVFDSDLNIKYALDGTPIGSTLTKGYVYPWQRGCIIGIDPYFARVQVNVDIAPTDVIYAFYSYAEYDLLFTGLDVNPFTNPVMRNSQTQFNYKAGGSSPNMTVYFTTTDESGNILLTNDDGSGTNTAFASLAAGGNISISDLTVTDIRQRGGGLAEPYITVPQAKDCWDLGFWDGAPVPTAGNCIVYIPGTVLNILSEAQVQSTVQELLPLGCIAVIIYYNLNDDSEFV
jgi:hypothetical protein